MFYLVRLVCKGGRRFTHIGGVLPGAIGFGRARLHRQSRSPARISRSGLNIARMKVPRPSRAVMRSPPVHRSTFTVLAQLRRGHHHMKKILTALTLALAVAAVPSMAFAPPRRSRRAWSSLRLVTSPPVSRALLWIPASAALCVPPSSPALLISCGLPWPRCRAPHRHRYRFRIACTPVHRPVATSAMAGFPSGLGVMTNVRVAGGAVGFDIGKPRGWRSGSVSANYSIFPPCNSALRPSVFSKFTFNLSPLKLSAHVCVSLCPRIRRSIENVFSFSHRPLTALIP